MTMVRYGNASVRESVARLFKNSLTPMDLLSHTDFKEKCIDLVLNGVPINADNATATHFHHLRQYLTESRVEEARVVIFGGGTGLSNILGGDSRQKSWTRKPFVGLKEVFPKSRSIVCVTDDGGSTGELIKDLPLVALGDIRHVLLSSIQSGLLQNHYNLSLPDARRMAGRLADVINYRFDAGDVNKEILLDILERSNSSLPLQVQKYCRKLVEHLFVDPRLRRTLGRSHCLGNLLLVAAIYSKLPEGVDNEALEKDQASLSAALHDGISEFSEMIGAGRQAVMPCTATPAQLRLCYTNGVEVSGECKSAEAARGYPVDRVIVDFSDEVFLHPEVLRDIEAADIIILAPGSLYSSVIPIFQTPEIAEAVRNNEKARKILVSNLWVQAGETDRAVSDPERKFHVSDMIAAYENNIPGGTQGLFSEVLCLSLKDVPASVLQNYALEGKIPIYLDKEIVRDYGYSPLECGIYSREALAERGVIQHDPDILATAVKTVFVSSELQEENDNGLQLRARSVAGGKEGFQPDSRRTPYPSSKYRLLKSFIEDLPVKNLSGPRSEIGTDELRNRVLEIIWKHQDIQPCHLGYIKEIQCVPREQWRRSQVWDKVFSFFDPDDSSIKIRSDQLTRPRHLEVAVLIALGQSLLGNYAREKRVEEVLHNDIAVGKIYNLFVRKEDEMRCFFPFTDLDEYLRLAKMVQSPNDAYHYTRLVNGAEGFTPPGMLMGLLFAWYLDNRLASHIEYKMALLKISHSDLIPEQEKMLKRRYSLIDFITQRVFRRVAWQQ